MQNKLRERENNIDQIQRGFAQLSKWKDKALELAWELRAAKLTKEYVQAQRLNYLENYVASNQRIPAAQFLSTFQPHDLHTFRDRLIIMLENAEFEVVIVSPWIKRQMWDKMKRPLTRFAQRGGKLRVFMRGFESDYLKGLSDDIQEDVKKMCGEIVIVKQLHAKIYMIDRKEAIVTSANLTQGGIENNYEAGAWLNDPTILKDICEFVNSLYHCGEH